MLLDQSSTRNNPEQEHPTQTPTASDDLGQLNPPNTRGAKHQLTSKLEHKRVALPKTTPTERGAITRAANEIAKEHDLSLPVARYAAARGHRAGKELRDFLSPRVTRDLPPVRGLTGARELVSMITEAVRKDEKIGILTDYDCDGATSGAQLSLLLDALGVNHTIIGSDRYNGGYGASRGMIRSAHRRKCDKIILADIGTHDHDAIEYAQTLNVRGKKIQVGVIDHHLLTDGEPAPAVRAFVNPHQPNCGYAGGELCTAGLTYVIARTVVNRLKRSKDPELRERAKSVDVDALAQLAALGSAADQMDIGATPNRAIVAHGLDLMNKRDKASPWVEAFAEIAGVSGEITAQDLVFGFAPRINAMGRMIKGEKMPGVTQAIQFLTAKTKGTAVRFGEKLDKTNLNRRATERSDFSRFVAKQRQHRKLPPALVDFDPSYHPGVSGINASRAVDKSHRPAILLTDSMEPGLATGSARTVPGVHIKEVLDECVEHLERHGGHEGAAGLSLKVEKIPDFTAAFEKAVAKRIGKNGVPPYVTPDVEMTFEELKDPKRILNDFRKFEPSQVNGGSNPTHRILFQDVHVLTAHQMGKTPHLAVTLRQGKHYLRAELPFETDHPALQPGNVVNLIGSLSERVKSEFNEDMNKVVLRIEAATLVQKGKYSLSRRRGGQKS